MFKKFILLFIFFIQVFTLAADIPQLIKDLGADSFRTRKTAEKELWKLVPESVPALEKAAASNDPEVSFRAKRILEKVSQGLLPELPEELKKQITEFWKKSDSEKELFLENLYLDEKQESFPIIRKLAFLSQSKGITAPLKKLFENQNFLNDLASSSDHTQSHEIYRIYAESGYPALFLLSSFIHNKTKEELKLYEERLLKKPNPTTQKMFISLLHSDGQVDKATKFIKRKKLNKQYEAIRLMENFEWPNAEEPIDDIKIIKQRAAKILSQKYSDPKDYQKQLKVLSEEYAESNPKVLIESLLKMGEMPLAMKIAKQYLPSEALALMTFTGDFQAAKELFDKNKSNKDFQVTMGYFYSMFYTNEKMPQIIQDQDFTLVDNMDMREYFTYYSRSIPNTQLLEEAEKLISANAHISHIKSALNQAYKISAHLIWQALGETDKEAFKNFKRLIKKEFSKKERIKLFSLLAKNSFSYQTMAKISHLYGDEEQVLKYSKLALNSGVQLSKRTIQAYNHKDWQTVDSLTEKIDPSDYYHKQLYCLKSLASLKLKKNNESILYFKKALLASRFSLYEVSNLVSTLVEINELDLAKKLLATISAINYLKPQRYNISIILRSKVKYLKKMEKHEEALKAQTIVTCSTIINSYYPVPRYAVNVGFEQIKHELDLHIAKNATEKVASTVKTMIDLNHHKMDDIGKGLSYLKKNADPKVYSETHALLMKPMKAAIKEFKGASRPYNSFAWTSAVCSTNLKEAKESILKGLAIDKENEHYWDTLADISLQLGEYEECKAAADKAIRFSYGNFMFIERKQEFLDKMKKN
ncbi:MAG: hypothetical protein NE334_00375 [Lentisphaeraceae bacterium]|nr:hypothetical protein [Lentisphaeraceae bacterium]